MRETNTLLLADGELLAERRRRRHRRSRDAYERRNAKGQFMRGGRRRRSHRRMRDSFLALENQGDTTLRTTTNTVVEAAKQGGLVALGLFGTRFIANLAQKYIPAPAGSPALGRWWGVLAASVATGLMVPLTKKFAWRRYLIIGGGLAIIQNLLNALNVGTYFVQTGTNPFGDAAKAAITGEPLAGLAGNNGLGYCAQGCPVAAPVGALAMPGCVNPDGTQPFYMPYGSGGYPVVGIAGAPGAGGNDGLGYCAQGCPVASPIGLQAMPGCINPDGTQPFYMPYGSGGYPVVGIAGANTGVSGTPPVSNAQVVQNPGAFVQSQGLMGDSFRANADPAAREILANLSQTVNQN